MCATVRYVLKTREILIYESDRVTQPPRQVRLYTTHE